MGTKLRDDVGIVPYRVLCFRFLAANGSPCAGHPCAGTTPSASRSLDHPVRFAATPPTEGNWFSPGGLRGLGPPRPLRGHPSNGGELVHLREIYKKYKRRISQSMI